jgi:6-phosphogluconolactonase
MASGSRREFLRGLGALGAAAAGTRFLPVSALDAAPRLGVAGAEPGGSLFAYVGGYGDRERNEHCEGIGVFRTDAGRWTLAHTVRGIAHPSYLIVDRAGRRLYAAHGREDRLTAFAIDPATGVPAAINTQSTGGTNPVRMAIDATGRHIVVANYASGSVAVLPVRADGGLGPLTDLVTTSGEPGPHRTEQTSAHPHDCPFDPSGRFVVVPDKGLDRVFVYRLDAGVGKLLTAPKPFAATRSGAGPRHVAFHPAAPFAYVINELDSTVVAYHWEAAGGLEPFQVVPSTPASFTGDNTGAEVVVSSGGRLLFASNRGHDSVGVYAIDQKSGALRALGWEATNGRTPRFIGQTPSGTHLFAANQNSDTIVGWAIDEAAGKLTRMPGVIQTGTPSTIAFARV